MSVWVTSLVFLILGCYFFERQTEQTFGVDIYHTTAMPCDVQYRAMSSRYLQLAQLGLIFGTESFLGIIIGLMYGPLTMIWCVVGTTFFGAGLVYYSGMYAQSTGKTLNSLLTKFFGKRVYHLLTTGLFLFICIDICSKFVFIFNVNHTMFGSSWWFFVILMVFAVCLLTPQNFIKMCVLTAVMILFLTGYFLLMSLSHIDSLPTNFNPWSYRELKYAYPFLFFTLSAGAISGSQALKSTIVAPYIKNEKMGTGIFWRTMFVHTGIVIIWNLMILAWNPSYEFIVSLVYNGANVYKTLATNLASHIFGGSYLLYITCLLIALTSIAGLMRAMAAVILETKDYPPTTLYVIETVMLAFCIFLYPLTLNYSFSSMNSIVVTIYSLFLLVIYLNLKHKPAKKYKLMILFLIGVMVSQFVLQIHNFDLTSSVLIGLLGSLLAYVLVYYNDVLDIIKNIKYAHRRRKVLMRNKKRVNMQQRLEQKAKKLYEEQQRQLAQEKENAAIKAMDEKDKKRQEEFLRQQQKEIKTISPVLSQKKPQEEIKIDLPKEMAKEKAQHSDIKEELQTPNKTKKKRKKKKKAKTDSQTN